MAPYFATSCFKAQMTYGILALCNGACFVYGEKPVQLRRLQKPLVRKGVDIHLLCQRGSAYQRMLYFESDSPVKVLSWCMNWNHYANVLALACLHQKQVVVAATSVVWNSMVLETAHLLKDCSPVITRLYIEKPNPANPSLEALSPDLVDFVQATTDTSPQRVAENGTGKHSVQKFEAPSIFWSRLSENVISLGCLGMEDQNNRHSCFSREKNTVAQALYTLNANFSITPVEEGKFAKALSDRKVDIIIHSFGLTPDRYQDFRFTVNRFAQAVYYVEKRWKHHAAFFLGVFPWLFLLALYMVVSASCFVLLNINSGHRPMSGLGEVVLALLATTLSLSASIRREHSRSRSGRVIMACWMLACFSLTTYTKSLLTASLMASPVWEADDSLEKMLPKLQRGRLLPCAENNSFLEVHEVAALAKSQAIDTSYADN
ncbi:hypothetical protein HPB49_022474 [Dermacentor silvarum]|uniref:Uncharacterized protein n=1 Tax=Dermacentor silvarum TaxID=543639 RepID=A0ACB8CTB7_DERSI|nr:hypothetical protein HPB49_022474 [Dermacentor silvarum]